MTRHWTFMMFITVLIMFWLYTNADIIERVVSKSPEYKGNNYSYAIYTSTDVSQPLTFVINRDIKIVVNGETVVIDKENIISLLKRITNRSEK